MFLQKRLCSIARPLGIGVFLSQALLLATGVTSGWGYFVALIAGGILAVIGHLGWVEWREYARARFDQIDKVARGRVSEDSEVLYLTESELDEVVELSGWRVPTVRRISDG